MRVIIAGGTGLIGRALAESLVRDGHETIVLSRSSEKASDLPLGAQLVEWDGRTPTGWGDLLNGESAIVNLAGANIGGEGFLPSRWTTERKQIILDSRLNAARAVFDAIRAAPARPAVVIQASAIGYYGPRGSEEIAEDGNPGEDFGAQVCLACENSLADVEEIGVRYTVIRTGIVFSKTGGALPRLVLPFRFFAGGPLGSGRQWMSWIHIADEVWAIRLLLKNKSASGVFNLTAPQPVTNAEFSRTLGRVMKRPSFLPMPAFAFRRVFGEVSTIVLDGQRVLPKRLLDLGFTFLFPSLEPALRELVG
ncbi:MAG: TIGR01777 family oxidoreductase [Anaerolineae bacterium]|nr:TIGR01777 family oxidoreductase [Anaerolineae bacterium]